MAKRRPILTLASAFYAAIGLGLVLPMIGIWSLRLIETALARQTEAELIGQASVIASLYADGLAERSDRKIVVGRPVPAISQANMNGGFQPRLPEVDLMRQAAEPPASAAAPGPKPDPLAEQAGAAIVPILKDAQRRTLAGMRVVDQAGVVVASSREEMGLSLIDRPEISAALLRGESKTVLRRRDVDSSLGPLSRQGGVRVFVSMPVVLNEHIVGAVVVSRTPISLSEWLTSHAGTLLGVLLILMATAGALGGYFAYAIRRPLVELTTRATAAAADGDLIVAPLSAPITAEIAALSDAIAVLSARQAERAGYIRDFATLVSHEFKTPLTGLAGALELLADDSMPAADRTRFLNNAGGDVARLNVLVSRLLDLARADMSRRADETTDLSAVLPLVVARWRERRPTTKQSQSPRSS